MSTLPEKAAAGVRRRPIPDELGQGLLQALAAWRPQAVSLHDTTGEARWLSSGSIGPDEHNLVLAALDVFALEPQRECMQHKLEDGRRALFLAARDPMSTCIGVSCAFIERGVIDEKSVITAPIHTLLQRFSTLLASHEDHTARQSALTLVRESGPGETKSASGPIRARKYSRLQSGGGIRRYEVSIAPVDAQQDAAVFERVAEWLNQNSARYQARPSSFTVPISAAAALDRGFARQMVASLSRHPCGEGVMLLSLPAAAWAAQPEATLPLLELCEQQRCHVMLDDFQLNDAALQLLRCKAVRMLKLSAELTTAAMQERYPRALLSACTHIARVLGIHCIAQRVESVAASRWLAVAGVDYLDQFNPDRTSVATTSDEPEELQLVS